jgi:secreted trypsin-like serine protease
MKISVFFLLIFFCLRPAYATDDKQVPLEPIDATSKILGGVQAAPGAWPWIAALLYAKDPNVYSAQFCSGVLIDKSWVLTAAHCVQGMSAQGIQVAVGAWDLTAFTGSRTPVKSIRIHPQFSSTSLYNDIALVELSVPSAIQPIALFSGESVDNTPPTLLGKLVTVLGWGVADSATSWYYPEILRQVSLPVVADSTCNDIYINPVLPSQFCAGYWEGKDACEGDSGGPAVVQVDGHWVHAGIVSAGVSCQEYFGWYGKYTRTSAYLSFIRQYAPSVVVTGKIPAGGTLPAVNLLLLTP